jgi:hypothetical protein
MGNLLNISLIRQLYIVSIHWNMIFQLYLVKEHLLNIEFNYFKLAFEIQQYLIVNF